jgi:glycosyltransferase involved in cell wall biosynthesis
VFAQTVGIDELFIVDDGSTDGTDRTVSALLRDHPDWCGRLKYFRQRNHGKSAALNVGLAHATGDWIAFNDSDDRWLPEKLELQFVAIAQHTTANACFTDVRFVNNPMLQGTGFEIAGLKRSTPFGLEDSPALLYFAGWPGIYMQSIVVRRETMAQVGDFDVNIRMGMDIDFGFRLGLVSPMCYVNRPLVEVDRTPQRTIGLTTEYPPNCIERLEVNLAMTANWLASARRSHPKLTARLQNRLWAERSALANFHLLRGDVAAARSILGQAAWQNPTPRAVAKLLWSVVAPSSLTREIVRRHPPRPRSAVQLAAPEPVSVHADTD